MMMTTKRIAHGLHKRFDEMNSTLNLHTDILREISSTQKEMSSSLKDLSSTQKNIEKILTAQP